MAIKEINELIGKKIELSDEEKREAAWNGFLSDIDNIKKEVASFWVEKEGIIGLSDDVLKIIKDNKEMAEGVFLDFDEKIKSIDQHCDFEINQDLALSMPLTLLRDALVQVDDNTSFDHAKGLILKNVESISDLKKRKEFKNRLNDILSRATNRGGREGGVDSIKELYSDISEEIKNQKGKVGGKAESAKSTNTEVDINDKKILFPAMIRTFKNDFIGAIEDKNPSFGKKATDLIQKLKDKGDGIGFRELSKSFSQLSEILVGRGVLTQEEVDGFLEKNKVIEKGMEEKRLQNIEEKKEEKRLQNKAVAEKGVDAASGDIVDDKMDDSGSIEGEASDSLDAGGAVDVKTESGTAELMSSDKLDDLEEGSTDKEGGGEVVEDVLEDDSAESGDAVVNPEVADFFNQFKTTYLSGDESEEEKERIIGEIEESSRQIQELLSSEDTPKNHKDYVEGMNFLLDHYSRAIYNSLTNYEGFLEEGKKEAEKKDSEFVELFKEVAEKLFVDIKKPTSHSEIQNRIHELTSQSFEYPVIPHIFSDLNSVSSDKEEFVKKLGVHMQSIGDLGASLKSDNQEAAESTERQILECQKVVYELTLMRDFLQNEEGEDFEAEEKLTKEEIDALLSNEPRGDSGDEEISLGATEADVDAEAKAEAEAEILDYRDEIGKIKDEMMGWINEITDKGYAETLQRKINAMWKETESLDLHKQGPKEWKDKLEEWKAERDHKNKQIDERGIRGGSADRKGADDHEPAKVGASDGADTSSSVDLGVSDKGDIDGADDKDILDIDDVVAVTDKSNTESGDVVEGKDIVSVNGKKEREYKKAQRVNLTEEEKKESVDAGFSTVDMRIEKMLSSDVVYGYKEFFGISEADLRHIEGFGELSEGQQLLVLENLKQLTLGRIKDDAVKRHQENSKRIFVKEKRVLEGPSSIKEEDRPVVEVERGAKWTEVIKSHKKQFTKNLLSNIWNGITKNFQVVKHEKILMQEAGLGGMSVHGDILRSLVKGSKDAGLDAWKNENGELEVGYFSNKDFENITDVGRKAVVDLNRVANEYSKIPYEWSLDTASKKDRKKFDEVKARYKKAKDEVLSIKLDTMSKADAASFVNERELKIELNRFFSNNPEVEKELEKIKNPLAWARALKSVASERGLYFAMGYLTRSAIAGTVGLASAPIVAAGFGAWRANRRANQHVIETKKMARRGKEDKQFKTAIEEHVDANYLSGAIEDLIWGLDNAENAAKNIDKNDDNGKKKNEELIKELLKSLRFHVHDAQKNLDNGTVNFGDMSLHKNSETGEMEMVRTVDGENEKNAIINQYELISKMSQGLARLNCYTFASPLQNNSGKKYVDLGVYHNYKEKEKKKTTGKDKDEVKEFEYVGKEGQYEADIKAIEELLEKRSKDSGSRELKYKTWETAKGAGISAGFAVAGYLFREYGWETTKGVANNTIDKVSKGLEYAVDKAEDAIRHASDETGIYFDIKNPIELSPNMVNEYGVKVIDDLDGNSLISNEEISMAQARELRLDNESINWTSIKKPLNAEDLGKLRDSGINDPRVIGAIMKNGELSSGDVEIKIARSGLSDDNVYKIVENHDFTKRIGEIVKNPAFEKLGPMQKDRLIDICFSGGNNTMDYDLTSRLSQMQEYGDKFWKIIKPSEAVAAGAVDAGGPSRFNLSPDQKAAIEKIAIEQNTVFEKVADGDSLTDITKRILLADNAGEDLREAFVKEHLGSDIDYANGDKGVLLDEAIKKMSRSNVGPNFGDGKDVNNLIYEGNRIGIDRETGKFVYQKADGVYASRAVSEKTLADNARRIYGDKHATEGSVSGKKRVHEDFTWGRESASGAVSSGDSPIRIEGAVYPGSAEDLATIHKLQGEIEANGAKLDGIKDAAYAKVFEGENGRIITDREYNGYDDRVFGTGGENSGEVVGGSKVPGLKNRMIKDFMMNGADNRLYPNAREFQTALLEKMRVADIKISNLDKNETVEGFIRKNFVENNKEYAELSKIMKRNVAELDGLKIKRTEGILSLRIKELMTRDGLSGDGKIESILMKISKGGVDHIKDTDGARFIGDGTPKAIKKMLEMKMPDTEIINTVGVLNNVSPRNIDGLLDACKESQGAFPKDMSMSDRMVKILEMDKVHGASYNEKAMLAGIASGNGEVSGAVKKGVGEFVKNIADGHGKSINPEKINVSFAKGAIKISVNDNLDRDLVMEIDKKGAIKTYREGWMNSDVVKDESLAKAKTHFGNALRVDEEAAPVVDKPQEAVNLAKGKVKPQIIKPLKGESELDSGFGNGKKALKEIEDMKRELDGSRQNGNINRGDVDKTLKKLDDDLKRGDTYRGNNRSTVNSEDHASPKASKKGFIGGIGDVPKDGGGVLSGEEIKKLYIDENGMIECDRVISNTSYSFEDKKNILLSLIPKDGEAGSGNLMYKNVDGVLKRPDINGNWVSVTPKDLN